MTVLEYKELYMLRRSKKISQMKIASQLGMTVKTYREAEQNPRLFTIEQYDKLMEVLS